MPRFLIEVSHEPTLGACVHTVEVFLRTGSHFLANADWGCMDGEHKAWIVLESDSREHARNVVPPDFRAHAKITQLNAFSAEVIERIKREHEVQ
ncbi:MAG: hypothetical protein ABI910_11080 [Gemmatimonadota bacterium]